MSVSTHLDLFSGIGGFSLAARWCGIDTVGLCENDPASIQVLKKNFPGVEIHEDIRTLDGGLYAGVKLITGGYPCQPFSVAGSQKAEEDDRNLWPDMHRVIAQAKPTWVICENVYGHIRLGLDKVLFDLEGIGYAAQPFVIPSVAHGRPHRRDRVFIVAYASGDGRYEGTPPGGHGKADGDSPEREDENSNHEGCRGVRAPVEWRGSTARGGGTEPPVLRVDDGLPRRMDRNRMIGNSVDPLSVYKLMRVICRVEDTA